MSLQKYWKKVKSVNAFEKPLHDEDPLEIRKGIISTRIYLVSLTISFIVIAIFASINTQLVSVTLNNPNYTDYSSLLNQSPDQFQCSCSNANIPISQFLTLSPVYHEFCNTFPSLVLQDNSNVRFPSILLSIRTLGGLCNAAKAQLNTAISNFMSSQFNSPHVIDPISFDNTANALVNSFTTSTVASFSSSITTALTLFQSNIPYGPDSAVGKLTPNIDPSVQPSFDYIQVSGTQDSQ